MKGKYLLLALALFSGCTQAASFTGRTVAVIDGDTMKVLTSEKVLHKIRLSAIDAPEKAQAFGQRSKQALSDLCFDRVATVSVVDTDRYGRMVADVWCDGIYANGAMVEQGLAWVYRRYAGIRADLYAAELDARLAKRGLWVAPFPTPPRDFRKSK